MALKELYNSGNPDLEFIPHNGWWLMRLASATPENALSIGLLSREGFGWGYWDTDATGQKEWIEITVPEADPSKLKHVPNYYEMGREMAYLVRENMTRERAIELLIGNCPTYEERVVCFQGMRDARLAWGWGPIAVSEADLSP